LGTIERQLNCKFTREQVEDLKSFGIDISERLEKILTEEINRNILENLENYINNKNTKEIKRVFSELDPYGEECWEN
jgi:hypothetical protein